MAYSNGRSDGRNWRNVNDDELDEDYDVAADDAGAAEPMGRNIGRGVSTVSSEDVRDGEFRVLREDTGYAPRSSAAPRPAPATPRRQAGSRPPYTDDYDEGGYGSDINSAYGVGPTRGGLAGRGGRPLVTVPRSIPWMSIGCFGVLIALAIALLVVVGSFGGALGGIGGFFGGIFGGGNKTLTVDTNSTAVVQQMRALNRLESADFTIEKVIAAYQKSDFLDSLYGGKVLFVAHADVVAGVDMSKMNESDITVTLSTSKTLQATIKLPPAEIFNTTLDEKKSYIYSAETNSIFGTLDPKIFDMVRSTAQDEITKAAQEQGILDQANRNARDAIELLLRRLGYTSVTFKLPFLPLPLRERVGVRGRGELSFAPNFYAIYLAATAPSRYTSYMSKVEQITTQGGGLSRREFITRSARVGLAASTLVVAANVLAACGDTKPPRYVAIGNLESFPAGKVVSVDTTDANGQKATIFVERRAGQADPLVLSDVCTHNGCHVLWVESQGVFGCPCHGGQYNMDGTVKSGPPPAPLAHLQVKVESSVLSVLI
jgi:cytochrome b6-f complex iron-sulfur subunit